MAAGEACRRGERGPGLLELFQTDSTAWLAGRWEINLRAAIREKRLTTGGTR